MNYLRIFYKLFIFLFASFLIVITGLYSYAYLSPAIALKSTNAYQIYDNSNQLIYQGSDSNKWVSLKQMSPNLINAVISVEDKNFYSHKGFDYIRIFKALINNLKNKTIVEGASTISQQYIKNAYLDFNQTWSRKIKEALMTLNLEMHYSKDEILEAYLNTINYGQGNYGVGAAANYYFNKNTIDLTLEECLILAGIPKNPNNYNPVSNYDKSIQRAKIVALTMLNNDLIEQKTYNNIFNNVLPIYGKRTENDLQMLMYFQDAVINELNNIPSISKILKESKGLKIYTTLDTNVQTILEKKILDNINDQKLQVASVIVDPNTGAIKGLTGGINYAKSQFNRAISSKRQVGSTMKPFIYYAALNNGMTSSSTFSSQYTTFTLSSGKIYAPKNYGNLYGNKDITMAAAVAYSDNVYAVKTNLFLGVNKTIETAQKCGIKEPLKEVASLALGTSELNLLDFATGYNTFASGGYKRSLYTIEKIEDHNGNTIYNKEIANNLVLNPNYVYILNELLTSTTNSAFVDYNNPTALNLASKLSKKYAFKTGTTDTDFWAVGYNKNILMLLWTGYDNNDLLPTSVGYHAKNIWAEVIENVDSGNNSWYQMPKNVIGIPLDAITGNQTNESKKVNIFYYLKGSEPFYSSN